MPERQLGVQQSNQCHRARIMYASLLVGTGRWSLHPAPARQGRCRVQAAGCVSFELSADRKEVGKIHAIGENPCYSSFPRRCTALQKAMSQKSLARTSKNVLQCKALLKRSGLHLAGAEEVEEI
ncbi:hypothetical protein [Delftia tsuruhatensis]|uniref:hypothetical protein n=1 Tax=Delftia tsuruhatensis TaxID=180282 RepID=UPI001F4182C5|nr:hypothetical protein [Delftia tsuruhatensis]